MFPTSDGSTCLVAAVVAARSSQWNIIGINIAAQSRASHSSFVVVGENAFRTPSEVMGILAQFVDDVLHDAQFSFADILVTAAVTKGNYSTELWPL
jgi:hypothetical protein